MDSIDYIIPIGVLIFVFMVGLVKHNRDIARDRYRNRYRSQTPARRKLIEELRKDGNDFEHIALVLKTAGYQTPVDKDFTANEVAQEHAEMVAQDDAARRPFRRHNK